LYQDSVDALRELIRPSVEGRVGIENRDYTHCSITRTSLFYLRNGLKHYFVEVTCDDRKQYGIGAYGVEADELYMYVHRLIMSEKTVEEQEKLTIVA
jgi:hypothetical protein